MQCCQWGIVIRLLIPLILILWVSERKTKMSGWVWRCTCGAPRIQHSSFLWPLNAEQGKTRHLQLSRWREYKWNPLQTPNYLQRLQLVKWCDGFAQGNMRGGKSLEDLEFHWLPSCFNKYNKAHLPLFFVSSRLFLIFVFLGPCAKPGPPQQRKWDDVSAYWLSVFIL